jgi:hypothetical protein
MGRTPLTLKQIVSDRMNAMRNTVICQAPGGQCAPAFVRLGKCQQIVWQRLIKHPMSQCHLGKAARSG